MSQARSQWVRMESQRRGGLNGLGGTEKDYGRHPHFYIVRILALYAQNKEPQNPVTMETSRQPVKAH